MSYPPFGKTIQTFDRRERVIGDDWIFQFTVTDETLVPPGPANLTGYTPGGFLNIPNENPLPINNSMVNVVNLASGQFTFTVPSAITIAFVPDNYAYSLQVYMYDQNNLRTTYLVVPLRVLMA